MSFDIGQRDRIQTGLIQGLPQVLIQHRLTGGCLPALALPAFDPGAQAVNQIFAVRPQGEIGMERQLLQPLKHLQGSLQLHPVVGGGGGMATEFLHAAVFETQQGPPAPRPRITAAGPIGGGGNHPSSTIRHRSGPAGLIQRQLSRVEVIAVQVSKHQLAQCQLRERMVLPGAEPMAFVWFQSVRSASASSGSKQGQTPECAHPFKLCLRRSFFVAGHRTKKTGPRGDRQNLRQEGSNNVDPRAIT